MVLNYIWISFFLLGLVVALVKLGLYLYNTGSLNGFEVFGDIIDSTFSMAELSFEIAIGLTGILCLWLGIMKIGENGGAVKALSRLVGPFFNQLFPDIPEDHPARGSMLMNFSANMLGLDNAATPMGLKAMKEMQELNNEKDTASNSMIMFLVLNTSGLTLIPVAVMNYRKIAGAENPADIFLPILIATFFASLVGLITVSIYQKINLFNKVILAYLLGLGAIIAGLIFYFNSLDPQSLESQSALLSNIILYGIICGFIIMALRKKVNVYESFIEGAVDGFGIAIKIIPYMVAILVAIGVFRASGAMDILILGLQEFFRLFLNETEFVHALPTGIMKPLSGSGARGMMLESFQAHGVDHLIGRMTSTLQGATDTTFYIIAVYFGSVGIRKTKYAIKAGLMADLAGVVAGIVMAYMFFGNGSALTPQEIVNSFGQNLNNPHVAAEFVSDDFYETNLAQDTLSSSKNEFITNYQQDSTTTIEFEFLFAKKVEDKYLVKTIRDNQKVNYWITLYKGKVSECQRLATARQ